MKRRTSSTFKVEIKKSRAISTSWVLEAESRQARDASALLERSGARASTVFAPPHPQVSRAEDKPIAEPERGSTPQPARILPDLISAQLLEARIQEEFEQRAAHDRKPAQPRRKRPDRVPDPAEVSERVAREPRGGHRRRHPEHVAWDSTPATAPEARVGSAPRVTVRPTRNETASAAEIRRAKRRGEPVVLRAGERWKRRLPRICW